MRSSLLLLVLALLVAPSAHARWDDGDAGLPALRTIGPLRNSVTGGISIVQDTRGRLYISDDHVWEYDGVGLKLIQVGDGDSVRALQIDDQGRIWCGLVNDLGCIEEDATGLRTFRSLRPNLPPGIGPFQVWGVHFRDGRTMFVCDSSVLIWDGRGFAVRTMPVERRLFSFESGGHVYLSQPGTGLWRWDGAQFQAVDLGGAEKSVTLAGWKEPSGRLVFLTQDGLVRLGDAGPERFGEETVSRLNIARAVRGTSLPDGTIAVTTYTEGVFIIDSDGAIVRHMDRQDLLPSQRSYGIALAEGNRLFMGTGVDLIECDARNRQSLFTSNNGPGGAGGIVVDSPEHGILALTDNGIGALERTPTRASSLQPLPFLTGNFRDLCVLENGWTVGGGLRQFLRIRRNDTTPLLARCGDILAIRSIPIDQPLLALVEGTGVSIVDVERTRSRIAKFDTLPAQPSGLACTTINDIWVASRREGLFRLDATRTEEPVVQRWLPGHELPTPFDDPGLFILGGEAYAYTPHGIFALVRTPDKSARAVLTGIGLYVAEAAGKDSLWAVAAGREREPSLVRLTKRADGDLSIQVTDQKITALGQPTSMSRTQDHILWIGGRDGFIRIDTREVGNEPAPQTPIVQAVSWRAGEQVTRLPLAGGPVVKFSRTGTAEFQLRDRADPFAPTQLIETRLAGSGEDWKFTGKTRAISGLDEGHYTLEARAVGFLGSPGPVVTYSFTILPPWFRTPLAYLGYVLALGGAIYGSVQWRTRRIRHQNLQLEQLVNRRTEELARAVSARSAFLANMGHEIRNPLNGVVGLVDTLRARQLADDHRMLVDRIGTCADQLISVIDDVMEYARIDAGRIALRLRTYAVREPVEAAVDIFRAARPEAVIEIHGDAAELDALVSGDPDRVRHILVNYLANALKFGNGTPVQVAVRRDGPLLVFAVTDHGPGIAPDEQAKLFVRFSRGSLAYQNAIPGTGLGLAACKAYAEAMGGDVSVESELGHGATFFLRLPFQPATIDQSHTMPVTTDALVGRKVLVVDDQDFNRLVLCDLLGRMGASAVQASSVTEARETFRAHAPDLVFVDFDLAGETGADLAEWIRNEAPVARDVPIIATTAFEVDEVRRRCTEAAMDGFLAKPVTAQRLLEVIAHIESVRSGGTSRSLAAPIAGPTPSSFLDILAGGDPARRTEIERSTWREVLTEALAAHRALRREDLTLTARHAHRLVSAALILSQRELVATARELNALAKAGDLPASRLCAERLRAVVREARRRVVAT